jgi:hypothetical protein
MTDTIEAREAWLRALATMTAPGEANKAACAAVAAELREPAVIDPVKDLLDDALAIIDHYKAEVEAAKAWADDEESGEDEDTATILRQSEIIAALTAENERLEAKLESVRARTLDEVATWLEYGRSLKTFETIQSSQRAALVLRRDGLTTGAITALRQLAARPTTGTKEGT